MDHTPGRLGSPAGGAAPPDHRLPSGTNKIERIAQHSKGLVDEITDWVELKLKLTQLEIQEKVDEKISGAVVKALPIVVGAVGGLFLLATVALGLGWWLGHPFWGFLIVTVLLLATAGILKGRSGAVRRALSGDHRVRVSTDALSNGRDRDSGS